MRVAAIHLVAGGADVAPLLASVLAEDPRFTLYAVWHLVTATLALLISVLWLCFGLVFLVVAFTQPGEGLLFKLPQWLLFIPVGALGLWGALRRE